jgi:glycerophosphoryl diester phosphodiesterase
VDGVRAVLQGGPLLIAHRGGAGLAPENTMLAFQRAVEDWGADMIEMDVRATSDGHCVVIHDHTVDRTTNGTGNVADFTLAEIQQLDAGYNFSGDGGKTFPFRGKGVRIPTIDEVLTKLPPVRLTVEVKTHAAQRGLFAAIAAANATDRVIAAGMHDRDRNMFPQYRGAKSASAEQAKRFYMMHRLHIDRLHRLHADVVQIPERWGGRQVVTAALARALRRISVPLHVWTVNDPADMNRLLDYGVDGLISDRPDIASRVLQERVGRAPAPIERGQH